MRQWLLVLFMLAVLAPTLSRALMVAQQRIAPWAELCATTAAPAVGGQGEGRSGAAHLLDVCATCTGTPMLAGSAAAVALAGRAPTARPAAPAPRPAIAAAAWAHAPSRGPPTVA